MSNSSLISYTLISPNKNSPRNQPIRKITIHHTAGIYPTAWEILKVFETTARGASCNYGIGNDGSIGLCVDEGDRSWCSSSRDNDHQAITIEVSNCEVGGNWAVGSAAMESLLNLCTDICRRNGISALNWTGTKSGNLTTHDMFAATVCPGPYLKSRMSWIASQVNMRLAADPGETPEDSDTSSLTVSKGEVTAGNYYIGNVDMHINARYIYQYMTAKGWTLNAISGMLGNMQAESGINPGIWQSLNEGNLSGGYGLVQWTPCSSYFAWADGQGLARADIDTQLKRILYELEHGEQYYATSAYPETFREFTQSTKSAQYLGMAFLANYERPANPDQPQRGTNATYWYNYLQGYSADMPEADNTDRPMWKPNADNEGRRKNIGLLLLIAAARRG